MDTNNNTTTPTAPTSGGTDTGKLIAIIGYIFPVIFFLPLVMEELKNNDFSKYHANQQLNLLLFFVAGQVIGTMLSVIVIGIFIVPLVGLASLVFAILGAISASKGEKKPLPLIGGFNLLK